MGCLFAVFAGLFPRLALIFVWIARPKMVDAAFDSWIVPLLGLLLLPFATLMYVILWQAGGLSGWDWFWVGLAALLDMAHWGAGARQRSMSSRATA
jgi:hypothetical protein